MPLKLPTRLGSVKSPARTRPSRLSASSPPPSSSSSRRSRSHDPDRRRPSDDVGSSRHEERRPHSRYRRRSPSPANSPPRSSSRQHDRRRRRGSSSSPERYNSRRDDRRDSRDDRGRRDYEDDGRRDRRRSLAVDRDDGDGGRQRRSRPSSVDYRNLRPAAAPGAFNREGENDPRKDPRNDPRHDPRNDGRRRSSTPDKYKPDKYKKQRSPSPPRQAPPTKKTEAAAVASPSPPESASGSTAALFNNMPTAIAAYAGLKTLSKQADNAKEWITWLTELSETPEEIQELSDKASTAQDTIDQVKQMLKARPDLLEGDKQGEALKEQIEDRVQSTTKALNKMTKLLSEISKKGADQGDVVNGMKDFWRSYRYKDEFEDKVKQADDEVQKELMGLSNLMLNLNTRALMKPPPVKAEATPVAAATPAAAKETPESVKKAEEKPAKEEPKVAMKEEPKEKAREEPKEAAKPPTETPAKVPLAEATAAATIAASSGPTIVEPPSSFADKQTKGKDEDPRIDKRTGLPQPPSPSTLGDEEANIGSPPMRSPPILITEPTKSSTTSAPTAAKESSGGAGKRDSSDPEDPKSPADEDKSPDDALLDAAWDGDLDAAVRALRHASPRVADDHGLTPLHLAAERDNLAVAMLLIDRGASVTSRSDGGRTALHLAARSASAPTVEMLLERGKADPNAETAKGRTPLHYAASKAADGDEERREVLRVLRDFGADPTVKDREGETARDVAQKREHWDAAATLRRAEKKWEDEHKQNWLQRHRFMK